MLLGSVAFNYAIGWVLCDRDSASDRRRRQLLLAEVSSPGSW